MNPHWWWINPLMPDDIDWIEQSGKTRNEFGKNRGWKSRTSSTDDKWNIMGMAGEWASSLVLNLGIGQITGEVDELNSGDLKGMIEVRTSGGSSPWQWDLGGFKSVLEKKRDRPFVHCISALYPETMIVTGWATGQEILNSPKVKRVQYRPDDPIHFIEQPNLRKIDELFNRLRIINNF